MEPARGNAPTRRRTGSDELDWAVRPQRILLGLATIALVLATDGAGAVELGADLTISVIVLAALNTVWNVAGLFTGESLANRGRFGELQIAVDVVLAFAAVSTVDVWSNPLVWILLLVPVVDGAFLHGWRGAVAVWGLVSLLHMNIVLWFSPADSALQDVVQAGVLQIVAVLGLAISVSAVSARVSNRLDEIRAAHTRSETQRHHLALVGDSAQRMGASTTEADIVAESVTTALALGLDRADLSEYRDGVWRLAGSAGHSSSTDPSIDPILARAAKAASAASIGVAGDGQLDKQLLEDLGYRRQIVLVDRAGDSAFALRAYIARTGQPASSLGGALEALIAHTTIATLNVRSQAELAAWADQLDHRASHDELTGLANRAALIQQLSSADASTGLLFLDLDGFKQVNDTYGHEAGDRVLITVADRLTAELGGPNVVGRLGGDEFVVITRDRNDGELRALADRILRVVEVPIDVGPARVEIGVSIGIARGRSADLGDGRDLLRRADGAMYQAKMEGRARGRAAFIVADERSGPAALRDLR
ncbi:MAG: GGDEF domain-containing protein [Actinomycetota bacterium]